MKKTRFSKILLLSNPGNDTDDPDFRVGSYVNYLIPVASALRDRSGITVKILSNRYVGQKIASHFKKRGFDDSDLVLLDEADLGQHGLSDAMTKSYHSPLTESDQAVFFSLIERSLGGWIPDVILCWETPTVLFRSLFPDALVLDLMPSMFMRPPYPKMISFDSKGIYKNCWFSNVDVTSVPASDEALEEVRQLRDDFLTHFERIGARQFVRDLAEGSRNELSLIPLQISRYFGWRYTSRFESQFKYLEAVLDCIAPEDLAIATQYVSGFAREELINDSNHSYFINRYPQLVYKRNFSKIDNISQYILPFVDDVHSVSSTLGIQAKFFGKRLISPSTSHLSYLADSIDLTSTKDCGTRSLDSFLANYLGRSCVLWQRVLDEPGYLLTILDDFWARREESGVECLPAFATLGNKRIRLLEASGLKASERILRQLHESADIPSEQGIDYLKKAIESKPCDIVSFDVFDTLVCRSVFQPVDIFVLMAARLAEVASDLFDRSFLQGFPRYRSGMERKLRYKLDRDNVKDIDELTIKDVYISLLRENELPSELADMLVAIEQEVELSCLQPRRVGKALFEHAKGQRKKIVIISDFIHPAEFVAKALSSCGYEGWDHLFVSSEAGQKKQSGALYDIVCRKLGIDAARIVHFGDNPHGDFSIPQKKGISAHLLKSGPTLVRDVLINRNFGLAALEKSLITGAILIGHANRYFGSGGARRRKGGDIELIATPEELGFLVIGPLMHFFSAWIGDQAAKANVKQIVFFARDSVLPFEMVRQAVGAKELNELKLFYLPVSRLALSGSDVFSPRELRNTRIDDFGRSRPISELLTRRFLLESYEISHEALAQWTDLALDKVKVGDLPEAAIYDIAIQSARLHWDDFEKRLVERRSMLRQALRQLGVDLSVRTIAVDFGYTGTIHRKLRPLFNADILPRFFMSFSGSLGDDPIADLEVFYRRNVVPQFKEDPFLKYNLIIETLINEGVGSALGYEQDSNGLIVVKRDNSVGPTHAETIERIHSGARAFSRYWRDHCSLVDRYARWEPNMIGYLISPLLTAPSYTEASILRDLLFDNSYSGHAAKPIIAQKGLAGRKKVGIWKEGEEALEGGDKSNAYRSWRLIYAPVVGYFVTKLGNDRDRIQFNYNPRNFFKNLTNPTYRRIGQILFP